MKCQNTGCKNQVGGKVVGLRREFCQPCELAAQKRVAA